MLFSKILTQINIIVKLFQSKNKITYEHYPSESCKIEETKEKV